MNDTFMKERPVLPLLLSMALPNVISMLVNSLYNIVDSLFVAQISEDAMTALSLVYPIQNFANAIAIGFGIGINAMIALYLGAGDRKKAEIAATHGMVLSLLHGVVITVVSIAVMPGFLRRFTTDESLVASGITYSTIVFLFATINMAALAFEKMFQAVGRMKVTMVALVFGCVCNILLDPVLIFGLGPVPAMGIAGAALATGIGQLLSLCVYLFVYLRTELPVRLSRSGLHPDVALDGKLYAIGVPAILNLALPSLLVTFLNSLLAGFSQSYVVVLGIYYKLQTFLYLPANGIVQGMRPLIGYNYGAREHARVKKLYELTVHEHRHHGAGHGHLPAGLRAAHRAVHLQPRYHRRRCQGPAHHLHRLCGVGSVHHLVRRTGGPWQGRAVAGDLAVPLCGVHPAAGRSAVRPPWPGRCVARLLDHRGAHRTGGLPGVPPRGGPALNLSGPFCSRLPDPGGLLFCCIPVALRGT